MEFSHFNSLLAQQEKSMMGVGWQFRFTQEAVPGHCCRLCNFSTEVCVLSYRDGSLITNNSSSHCAYRFLSSWNIRNTLALLSYSEIPY